MTTKEFLDIYDSQEIFDTEQLIDIFWGGLDDEVHCVEEGCGDFNRWDHYEYKILKIEDRYFEVGRMAGNTEYQENDYNVQPIEVYPYEKTVTAWAKVIR